MRALRTSVLMLACLASSTQAENSALTTFGDVIHHGMPVAVMGVMAMEGGSDALKDAALANLANRRSVLELKKHVHKERPNGTDARSFPSGHAASTFGAAATIHARYGFGAAMLPYALAGITAFSRVKGEHHDVVDVTAGAALGMAWSFAIVESKQQVQITPKDGGLNVSVRWDIQ
jgi:membrane-associated phospholipid phosphatase